MVKTLSIIAILLFCFSYPLTDVIAGEDLQLWWKVKQIIYNICIGLSFFIAGFLARGWAKFILHIGLGVVASDIIDRVCFDITTFNSYDIILLGLNILVCSYKNVHLLCQRKM